MVVMRPTVEADGVKIIDAGRLRLVSVEQAR
jgi:hypothetical protein